MTVAVTIASDTEPVECEGEYSPSVDGFSLTFSIARDTFKIEHTPDATRIVAVGDLSYDLTVGSENSETLLSTPYGKVMFDVIPVERRVSADASGVRIVLKYKLSSANVGEMLREADISARFLNRERTGDL